MPVPMAENAANKAIQDYSAERAVLGGILADKRKIADVASVVRRDDFFYEPHAEIFDACIALDLGGKPVDTLTLADELKTRGTLSKVGGLAYLAELDTAAPTAANSLEYARIVGDKAIRRRLLDADQAEMAARFRLQVPHRERRVGGGRPEHGRRGIRHLR